jgi:hypothetical protein
MDWIGHGAFPLQPAVYLLKLLCQGYNRLDLVVIGRERTRTNAPSCSEPKGLAPLENLQSENFCEIGLVRS